MTDMPKVDLHVDTIYRLRGGVLNASAPIRTDFMGLVSLDTMPDGKKMYKLESGGYHITFKEKIPKEFEIYNVNQYNLLQLGMVLTINVNPERGFLQVHYPCFIEEGSLIATLHCIIFVGEKVHGL